MLPNRSGSIRVDIEMKRTITRLLLTLEYKAHRVDAYLATMRGDKIFAADCLQRSWDIERRISWMEIQP